jgi:hypothetical protein
VTMAAGWCGGRGPLPDPGRATWRYTLTTGGRLSARAHLREEEREGGGRSLGGRCPTTPTTAATATSVPPRPPTPARPGGRSTKERGRRRGGRRWWGSDECARSRRRSYGRGRCVVAPGELLQGKGITDLQGGWRLLVRQECPHGLVAAGKAPQNVED